jgi:hypothetical protein
MRNRLAVSEQATQKIGMDRFDLKKLNEREITDQFSVTITNKFAALENLEENGDINRAWDSVRT